MNNFLKNATKMATVIGTFAGANALIDHYALEKGLNEKRKGETYFWKHGDIFYTVAGEGEPLLLIHNLHQDDCSYEWKRMMPKLREKNKVYAIDLLGCGKSDKPNITYTNYMYVQLVTSFIKNVIKKKADVIVTGDSAPFVIMAKKMDPDTIGKIIAINPSDLKKQMELPDSKTKFFANLLATPVVGRFIYNMMNQHEHTNFLFRDRYFYNKAYITSEMKEFYYETSHLDKSRGRFLLASIIGRYTNLDIRRAVREISDLFIIASRNRAQSSFIVNYYTSLNPDIEVCYLSNVNLLPQLENPEKTYEGIIRFL